MKCPVCGQAFSPKGLAIHNGMKHNPDPHGLRAEIARLRSENASLGILIELHEDERARLMAGIHDSLNWEHVRRAERARILAAVEAIDPTDIIDPDGYRIDSAEAMRAAVIAAIKGEATDD